MRYAMIAIGGALGAIARYEITNMIQGRVAGGFPYGTFIVNVSGCLIMGLVIGMLEEQVITNPNWRFLITTGFLGAYTTFSTFEAETFNAAMTGAFPIAAINVLGSVVLGYLGIVVGFVAARVVHL